MKVHELIELLQTYPQDLDVIYSLYSEHATFTGETVGIIIGCVEREDGWIQRDRPDMPTKKYLTLT